jgi:hypothetical protein
VKGVRGGGLGEGEIVWVGVLKSEVVVPLIEHALFGGGG